VKKWNPWKSLKDKVLLSPNIKRNRPSFTNLVMGEKEKAIHKEVCNEEPIVEIEF